MTEKFYYKMKKQDKIICFSVVKDGFYVEKTFKGEIKYYIVKGLRVINSENISVKEYDSSSINFKTAMCFIYDLMHVTKNGECFNNKPKEILDFASKVKEMLIYDKLQSEMESNPLFIRSEKRRMYIDEKFRKDGTINTTTLENIISAYLESIDDGSNWIKEYIIFFIRRGYKNENSLLIDSLR